MTIEGRTTVHAIVWTRKTNWIINDIFSIESIITLKTVVSKGIRAFHTIKSLTGDAYWVKYIITWITVSAHLRRTTHDAVRSTSQTLRFIRCNHVIELAVFAYGLTGTDLTIGNVTRFAYCPTQIVKYWARRTSGFVAIRAPLGALMADVVPQSHGYLTLVACWSFYRGMYQANLAEGNNARTWYTAAIEEITIVVALSTIIGRIITVHTSTTTRLTNIQRIQIIPRST